MSEAPSGDQCPSARPSTKAGACGKIALVLFGLCSAVILLEVVLQAGALVAGMASRRPETAESDALRILCLGDSNTYGLYVERDETYPEQLKTLWNDAVAGPQVEVINFGFPGMNSSQVLRDLDSRLAACDPAIVLVKVGVNDFWTVPVPVDNDQHPSVLATLSQHSRVYRLARLLNSAWTVDEDASGPDGQSGFDGGSGTLRYGAHRFQVGWKMADETNRGSMQELKQNLVRLTEQAKQHGVQLVFLNYASGKRLYLAASNAINEVATATGTPVIDLQSEFRRVCSNQPHPRWLYDDGHPRADGYTLIAQTIAHELPAILSASPELLLPKDVATRLAELSGDVDRTR
jgi:lysophospholipase L1-like esterase